MAKPVVINVKTLEQFTEFLRLLRAYQSKAKSIDTETNGLYPYNGNKLISMSIYFPDDNITYNVAFFQGEGEVEKNWTKTYPEGTSFFDMKWQGKLKYQLYLEYWFNHFKEATLKVNPSYFGNVPAKWLDKVKKAWVGDGAWVLHNSNFDAHVLNASGFPDMVNVYDTMVEAHLVNEDWRHVKFIAPYTYTAKDAPTKNDIGLWATNADGTLRRKEQYGNRQLKWLSAFVGLPYATDGEMALFAARRKFEETLTDHIMNHLFDPMNESLLLAAVKRGSTKPEDLAKQREKIRDKVRVDDKANLWMLPSDDVAYYAGLDVVLTWGLHVKMVSAIKSLGMEDLLEKQAIIHHKVAWQMEKTGFKIDRSAIYEEITKYEAREAELIDLLQRIASEYGVDDLNPSSNDQLLRFLNSGVLRDEFDASIFPSWFNEDLKADLETYDVKVRDADLGEQGDELYGTNKKEFEKVENHAVIRMVRELRKIEKSVNTYLKKWLKAADKDGIVHAQVNDTGTVAGRASSSGDAGNFQNIPDRGYSIKKVFVPLNDEWLFGAADYGQLELRLGAWIGETLLQLDPNMTMTNLFLSGEDMHSYVRDMIDIRTKVYGDMTDDQILIKKGFDLQGDEKVRTAEQRAEKVLDVCRQIAKTMNFGLLYSGGGKMLSKLLGLDIDVAKVLVNQWRELFPAFPETQKYLTELALTRRYYNDIWETKFPMNAGSFWPQPDLSANRQLIYPPTTASFLNKRDARMKPALYGENNARIGMYIRQPISGRIRQFDMYDTQQVWFDDGVKKTFNPREAAAHKVWNNVDQGLGGYICMLSAYRIKQELGDAIQFAMNIHDALEFYIRKDSLHLMPRVAEIMVDWPQIVPNLTVDLQASKDSTWNGITKIKNMSKWVASGGKEGL